MYDKSNLKYVVLKNGSLDMVTDNKSIAITRAKEESGLLVHIPLAEVDVWETYEAKDITNEVSKRIVYSITWEAKEREAVIFYL